MRNIIAAIIIMVSLFFGATCDRYDMYDMATNGLPPQGAIYLYSISTRSGDLDGRDSIDTNCYTEGFAYTKLVNANTVKAFLSYSPSNTIRYIVPEKYWSYPVIGIAPTMVTTQVSTSWNDLMNNITLNPINTSVGLGALYWWSGSLNGGFASTTNCNEWSDSYAGIFGWLGGTGIDSGTSADCSTFYNVLCIAY